MDIEKDHSRLVRKAQDLPGVAELMAIYRRLEKSYLASQPYLREIKPVIFFSNTDRSTNQ